MVLIDILLVHFKGMGGHYGTYHSIIYGIASEKEGNLKKLRKELFASPLPKVGPKLKLRYLFSTTNLCFDNITKGMVFAQMVMHFLQVTVK